MTQSRIDVELLISLIENRPLIWDKSTEDYKDKKKRIIAWREICIALKDDFEEMEETEKQNYAKLLVKKWNQVRDSWIRSLNAKYKTKKKYCYHNQLLFLKKNLEPAETCDSVSDETHDSEPDETHDSVPAEIQDATLAETYGSNERVELEISYDQNKETDRKLLAGNKRPTQETPIMGTKKRKKRDEPNQKVNPMDHKMMSFIDNQVKAQKISQNEDRFMCFFKSLLPSVASLNDDQILQFQAGVITLLQDIKTRNRSEWSNQQQSLNYSDPLTHVYITPQYRVQPSPSTSIQSSSQIEDVKPPPADDFTL